MWLQNTNVIHKTITEFGTFSSLGQAENDVCIAKGFPLSEYFLKYVENRIYNEGQSK